MAPCKPCKRRAGPGRQAACLLASPYMVANTEPLSLCPAGRPASRTSESLGSGAASLGTPAASAASAGLRGEALRRCRWLGPQLWHPACAGMSQNELALQAVYSRERSRQIANEPLVQALKWVGWLAQPGCCAARLAMH